MDEEGRATALLPSLSGTRAEDAEHNAVYHLGSSPSPCHVFFSLRKTPIQIATALVYYGLVIALSDQSSPGRCGNSTRLSHLLLRHFIFTFQIGI